jgi:hypothetical protein
LTAPNRPEPASGRPRCCVPGLGYLILNEKRLPAIYEINGIHGPNTLESRLAIHQPVDNSVHSFDRHPPVIGITGIPAASSMIPASVRPRL